ncbi:head-tail connector protein [Marinovum algicola]|uniref:head-tail connector protein n=1 Tax=Marinovum algicola TaxID=42444 RepID=UPI0024BB07F3|nr:head-tail connector protein [Marinovum algicola]
MMLVEETNVPLAALPVEEFKAHLRLGSGFAGAGVKDAVLASFLRAAIAAIEARTGKALILRPFTYTVERWRETAAQRLPVAPVTAVSSVTITDAAGTAEVVDPGDYRLRPDAQAPQLRATGNCLPVIPAGGSAAVAFSAGYAPDWAGLPADLGQAVMLLAAHYYEYRDETALGQGCMPFGVTTLIERYRMMRAGFVAGGLG